MGFAGGLLILNEVGGIGTNLLGDKLDFNQPNSILIANPSLHREILNHHLNQQRDTLITLHEKDLERDRKTESIELKNYLFSLNMKISNFFVLQTLI